MDGTELTGLLLVTGIVLGLPLVSYSYHAIQVAALYEPADAVIELRGWATEDGGWTPRKIVVTRGTTVRLLLFSSDMTHSFAIPELGIDSGPITPGHSKLIEFVVDRIGVFTFYCGLVCSPLHDRMIGKLIVVGATP